MEEKRKDLKSTQQKQVIQEVIQTLNQSHPSFYYLPTIELAAEIKRHIHQNGTLIHDKFELVKDLSRRDIQILLSLHGK
ncbi:MAG: hypothetical protein ACI9FR_002301 [Cryomorphaceae bacterium]|jgi:hypothetical protein